VTAGVWFNTVAANPNTLDNNVDSKNKTEVVADNDKIEVYRGLERFEKPVFMAGSNTDALRSYRNGKMTVHIAMPSNWEKSGDEIAQKMANVFADTTYTYYRVNIAAFHEVFDNVDQPIATIYMDGGRFHLGERAHFTLKEVGRGIQAISIEYLNEHGLDKRVPVDASIVLSLD
jgi:hypothetical protein